ncbi:MAG TPA: TIR domain-containing protein [Opitutaceae bacterium]|nr:TIR domain-containing protein [Opitutaceae bacterium]
MPASHSSSGAVFLSYAREDGDAVRRIAEALRSFGVEVWFDQAELRGGDAWDARIKKQIRECALFIAVISANTQARHEGYFRREWKLAVERTHDMAASRAFLVPVVIDDTPEGRAEVPDEFMRVQWTRLHGALPTPQFVEQVKRLLEPGGAKTAETARARPAPRPAGVVPAVGTREPPQRTRRFIVAATALASLAAAGIFFALRKPAAAPPGSAPLDSASVPAGRAPDKSIAVLPFANLSTEKENEFFADGVQDDVITNLAKIRDLTVISRTSTLAYRDSAARNLKKIAADLNVATILEGSVRRVGNRVHMNAQLIDARTDAHLWAETFDGDASDIFALQADLAQKIAAALKATLTTAERSLIERRPTENPEAYALYLRAKVLEDLLTPRSGRAKYEQVAALYAQAVALDPHFALGFYRLTFVHGILYWFGNMDPTPARRAQAEAAFAEIERLAPNAPETHVARGILAYFCDNDWRRALGEFVQAEGDLPNDARLESLIGYAHRRLGEWPEAVRHLERCLSLDPHDFYNGTQLAAFLIDLRRFDAAGDLARRMTILVPEENYVSQSLVRAQFGRSGDHAAYLRALRTLPRADDDPGGYRGAYFAAYWAGDFAVADRALAEAETNGIGSVSGILNEPAALHRALLAVLRGDREQARTFAAETTRWFQGRTFNARQQPYVVLCNARAKALAGDAAAVPELRAAVERALKLDAYSGRGALLEAARTCAALGLREEALEFLARLMDGPSPVCVAEIRIDPALSRLKDDPRFESLLADPKNNAPLF